MKFPVLLGIMCFLFSFGFYFFLVLINPMILEVEMFSSSSVPFSFILILDKISMSFNMVVTLISFCVFSFACLYMSEDPFFFRFIWILLFFVISMSLLTFSGSLFFLLLGWDGLGITSFALIIYYQSSESLSAGFQTLMANRIGDALIVSSMFLFVLGHHSSFMCLTKDMWLLVVLLSVAALTKSAQYPFSSWLPAAMAAPTPVSALVHSSTLVTAGIFLIIRLSYNMPLVEGNMKLLLLCGSVTCLLGGWAATFENDIKKIIALSTLSQLGVMVFSLGLGLPFLSLFHLYTHALFKALLFLSAGAVLMSSFGAQDVRLLGSIGLVLPLPIVMFNISSLCLIGAPFLSAFYSKHLILEKMVQSSTNIFSLVVMFLATLMTSNYVFRTLKAISWSAPSMTLVSTPFSHYVSWPLTALGLGGLVGGKLLSLIDFSNIELAYVPFLYSTLISLATIIGIFIGLSKSPKKKSFFLSSMFFLVPVFSKSLKLLSPIIVKLKMLDYGWLEPRALFSSFAFKVSLASSSVFSWPVKGLSMIRVFWGITFIMFAYINIF